MPKRGGQHLLMWSAPDPSTGDHNPHGLYGKTPSVFTHVDTENGLFQIRNVEFTGVQICVTKYTEETNIPWRVQQAVRYASVFCGWIVILRTVNPPHVAAQRREFNC